jgi:hypothetical protein
LGAATGGAGGPADAGGGASAGGAAAAPATTADPTSSDSPDANATDANATDANATDDSVDDVSPTLGSPQVPQQAQAGPTGVFYAEKKGMAQTVQIMSLAMGSSKGYEYTSDFHVDPDGAGGWYIKDKTGRATTTLKYSKTESLDPGKIPYIVVPPSFRKDFPAVKLGDYAAVTYGGKTVYAIIGDVGPEGVIGAGSISLASSLGMDPTPKTGGASGGVSYVILAGSRDKPPARARRPDDPDEGRPAVPERRHSRRLSRPAQGFGARRVLKNSTVRW